MNRNRLLEELKRNLSNTRFNKLCRIAETFGFRFRGGKGSHRIYVRDGIEELLNFQNVSGKAKPYQVKQLIKLIEKYGLARRMVRMNKYAIEIFYSEEDEGYIVVVPELPGCSVYGETEEEALEEAKIAMDLWLETAEKEGRNIPSPRGKELLNMLYESVLNTAKC